MLRGMPPSLEVRAPARAGLRAALALSLVALAQFSAWRPTNFAGVDEWLILSLNSRGIVSFPHANRPLHLLWGLPGFALTPYRFEGYFLVHVLYLVGGAWLTWWLVSRIAPRPPALALLAAAFALTWAPLDMARLATVQMLAIAGSTGAVLLALALLLEAWRRGHIWPLAAAIGLGFLAVRSYEAALAPLLAGPLLLRAAPDPTTPGRPASRLRFSLAWLVALGVLAVIVAAPFLTRGGEATYQAEVHHADFDPVRWAGRMGRLYAFHLGPLLLVDAALFLNAGAVLAVLALVVGGLPALRRPEPGADPGVGRGALLSLAALGLVLAGLGYSMFALSSSIATATRTQFFAAPGIGLFLAAILLLAASLAPAGARPYVVVVPAVLVIAGGIGHGRGMQREWDRIGYYPAQTRALRAIVRAAPALRPHTLVLLLDDDGAFPYALTFRHAVAVLYGEDVVGHAVDANPFLYTASVQGSELRIDPWPIIAGPWRERASRHRFEDAVAFRLSGGQVSLLDRWEGGRLPALPPGSRYAPRSRILDGPAPPGRRVLAP